MERIGYKEQLILKFGEGDYAYYMFNEWGDVDDYEATSLEACKSGIDRIIEEQGGYYNEFGELL